MGYVYTCPHPSGISDGFCLAYLSLGPMVFNSGRSGCQCRANNGKRCKVAGGEISHGRLTGGPLTLLSVSVSESKKIECQQKKYFPSSKLDREGRMQGTLSIICVRGLPRDHEMLRPVQKKILVGGKKEFTGGGKMAELPLLYE